MKDKPIVFPQERLREIIWEIGKEYPISVSSDHIVLSMVNPHLGHVHWHAGAGSREAAGTDGSWVVRIYDVTDIEFDGSNAHAFFDLEVGREAGNHYFQVPRQARNYVAELGLRAGSGAFHPLIRSNVVLFERDGPSGNYQVSGLFVGGALQKVFPVENIFDAPVYERINQKLLETKRPEALSVALVFVGINQATGMGNLLGDFIKKFSQKFGKFGGNVRLFSASLKDSDGINQDILLERIAGLSERLFTELSAAHEESPFHVVHCHDWYSSAVGLMAAEKLDLPMVLSLHSTEYERAHGYETDHLSSVICKWERTAVQAAQLIIVPHSSTRHQVISLYEASPDKVVIIPDVRDEGAAAAANPADIKNRFGLDREAPMVLFAGEISHAAGADLMLDALPHVCGHHATVQFVFAGDGPLRGELEARAWQAGLRQRCHFMGDVSSETFRSLLSVCDFVVIPARTWQDEGLAQMAIGHGKPVLTTHQAGINCVSHGQNGLIAYDNPGSITWGIQELLFNPLQGNLARLAAHGKVSREVSLGNVVAQHYMYYETALRNRHGSGHG